MNTNFFNKITLVLFFSTIFFSCTYAQNSGNQIKPLKKYKGVVHIGLDKKTPEPFVIKDKDAYYNFIGRIPEFQISMSSDAPKSDDPLLNKPKINFKKTMLVVIYNYSISSEMKEFSIEEISTKKVKITYRTESFISAQPIDVCGYYAFIIPKYDEIEFVNLNALNMD